MAISPFESSLYRNLFHDPEVGALLSDQAEIDSMLRVEAALARVQGALGIIPAASAAAISTAAAQCRLEPADLAAGTGRDGVPVPALVETFREAIGAPEHASYLHWGATTQDIMDTALVLRLRDLCAIYQQRLTSLLSALARLAADHAELPMAAHTRRQIAIPTSFGALVAAWGVPLLNHLEVLEQIRPRLLKVSLAGAVGNSAVLKEDAARIRSALAAELELADSDFAWHSDRAPLAEFASLLTRINGSLAKMGEDIILAAQSEVGEVGLIRAGTSSTMPHKQNPVAAEGIQSLFRLCVAMDGLMNEALLHRQQRDGIGWALEWHALPQICMACACALNLARTLVLELEPDAGRMRDNLDRGNGLVYAEAISFSLAEIMSRPQAQTTVKELCNRARAEGSSLKALVAQAFPQIDWDSICTPEAQLGDAPAQAHAFAKRVQALD